MMLGMSLLQKNFIGIGFSLIFLQFSGFLKLSLLMAATTLVVGKATEAFQKYFKEVKRVKELRQAIGLITGAEGAGDIIVARSEQIVSALGIEGDTGEAMAKGLQQAMVELNFRGIEPTAEAMRVFAQTMAIEMQIRGKTTEEALTSAMNTTIEFSKALQEGTHEDTVSIDGVIKKMDEFDRMGGNALASLSAAMSNTSTEYSKDIGSMIQNNVVAGVSFEHQSVKGQEVLELWDKIIADADQAFIDSGRGIEHTEALISAAFAGLPAASGVVVETTDSMILQFIKVAVAADQAKNSIGELAATSAAIGGEFFLTDRPGGALDAVTQEFEDRLDAQANVDRILGKIESGDIFRPGQGNALSALADIGWEVGTSSPLIGGSATPVIHPRPVEVIINGTIVTKDEMADAVQIVVQDEIVDKVRLSAFTGFNNPIA